MKTPYKLVVCDIDGTLVNDSKVVSPVNREAIERFRREGGELSLATGRIEKSVASYCRDLAIRVPVILYNGARIYNPHTGEVIKDLCLTPAEVRRAASLIPGFPFDFIFYSRGEAYILRRTDAVKAYEKGDGFTCAVVPDLQRIIDKQITKILMIGDNRYFDKFRKLFREGTDCRANLVQSENTYLEILPEGTNKGKALKDLASHLGLSLDEVICFGDNLNDLEMIQMAGMGVAMSNGRKEVREAADLVAPENNKDGVGIVLNSLMEEKDV